MSKHVAINALLAIGMTFIILTGGIDLSVGSIVGLTAMIAGGLINEGIQLPQLGVIVYPHTWMIIVLSLAAGTLMGAISGFIITRFNVPPSLAHWECCMWRAGLRSGAIMGYTLPISLAGPEYGNTALSFWVGQSSGGQLLSLDHGLFALVLIS